MIASTKILKKYCTDYKNIDNYEEAVKSPLKYDLHHRLEIDEMQTRSDLIFLHLYYHRPPEELIFLEHREHMRLHNAGNQNPMFGKPKSAETKQKMSEALKGRLVSEDTRKKISESKKGNQNPMFGKHPSANTRKKISEARKGKHWHLENGRRIYTD